MRMIFIEGVGMSSCYHYQGLDIGYPVISVNFRTSLLSGGWLGLLQD